MGVRIHTFQFHRSFIPDNAMHICVVNSACRRFIGKRYCDLPDPRLLLVPIPEFPLPVQIFPVLSDQLWAGVIFNITFHFIFPFAL